MHKKIVIIIITIIIVVIIILTLVCSLFASFPDVSLLFPYIPISSTGSCQKKPVYNNVKRYTREPDILITFGFFANMFLYLQVHESGLGQRHIISDKFTQLGRYLRSFDDVNLKLSICEMNKL